MLALSAAAAAQEADPNPTGLEIFRAAENAIQPQNLSTTLVILILVTLLTLAPAILVMTTSFTRIIVVLGFLRQAMATQQSPPNQVLIGLALILTFYIMAPTYQRVYDEAIHPYLEGEVTDPQETLTAALNPMREFMFRQTKPKDLALFVSISHMERPNTRDDVPTLTLAAAFVLSEMETAFIMGFLIYIPFLIIDMVVASTLMSMGMMMLPPVFVSLPFKIIMFVLADGWYLLIEGLVRSFH
ncbi:MAG: flagellar type III secretion system pore protein FliP [Candidatus Hydrogenedentes bacterium]|nr:flagellar type III secretion system pore protein FliP [Candidatus Hydrogenedentota bacterium]